MTAKTPAMEEEWQMTLAEASVRELTRLLDENRTQVEGLLLEQRQIAAELERRASAIRTWNLRVKSRRAARRRR